MDAHHGGKIYPEEQENPASTDDLIGVKSAQGIDIGGGA